jgi:SAM-dependent methyltransferase
MSNDRLTEKEHWDDYWKNFPLPAEVSPSNENLLLSAELRVFEKYLPKKPLSVLEIGGAPGQYLAWFHKNFGYKISCLDYSEPGCRKTLENFRMLGIEGKVIEKDLFTDLSDLPRYDIVYSMGVIEHFEDVRPVISKHLELLKPGGLMMFGLPNFRGINHFFLKRLAPDLLSKHNLTTMDISTWHGFEKAFSLKTIYKGYVGGFEPMTFLMKEQSSFVNNLYYGTARVLNGLFHRRITFLRKYNAPVISGYILAIYQKPIQ